MMAPSADDADAWESDAQNFPIALAKLGKQDQTNAIQLKETATKSKPHHLGLHIYDPRGQHSLNETSLAYGASAVAYLQNPGTNDPQATNFATNSASLSPASQYSPRLRHGVGGFAADGHAADLEAGASTGRWNSGAWRQGGPGGLVPSGLATPAQAAGSGRLLPGLGAGVAGPGGYLGPQHKPGTIVAEVTDPAGR
ncbi:unnamed protein product [Protopolystoma xenopodis]|uniref:Uncharacterized protein n=1 Tax=Protopolystoma xenopodis TaxID=117903 RepID=A0A448WDQ8_9PLAT|nr:unnamed protein product [Protopolystoma xenopodis]